ncbi:MAG: hypothetical protein V1664_05630 [Candidatus Uhrbacteria bacterium]
MTGRPEQPHGQEQTGVKERLLSLQSQIENRGNRFEAIIAETQAAQLMDGEDKLRPLLAGRRDRELRKFPIGGTRLWVEFTGSNPIFKLCTSEHEHQGEDIDKLLRALIKYQTPVNGASWPGFTDSER